MGILAGQRPELGSLFGVGTVWAKKEKRKNIEIQAVVLFRASACYGAALSWLNVGDEEILKKSAAAGSRSG